MDTPITGTSFPAILGQTLAYLRKRKNFTQANMANAMGISISSWSRIEKGEADISVVQLRAAANILETTETKILEAARAGETDAKAKGVKVDAEAKTGTETGKKSDGIFIPIVGGVLLAVIGAAIAAVLTNASKDV